MILRKSIMFIISLITLSKCYQVDHAAMSKGYVYYQMGEYKKAIEEFKNDYDTNKYIWDYYYFLGLCYSETGNYIEAVRCFQKAKELKRRTRKIDRELFRVCVVIAQDYYQRGMLDSSAYYYNLGILSYRRYLKELR